MGKHDLSISPILERRDKSLKHQIEEVKHKISKMTNEEKSLSREEKIIYIKEHMRKGFSYNESVHLAKNEPSKKQLELKKRWEDLLAALHENNIDRNDQWHFNMPSDNSD